MPPKRKAAPKKKKQETPPPSSDSDSEPESEPELSESEEEEEEPESPQPKKTKPSPKSKTALAKAKVAPVPAPSPKNAKATAKKKQPAKKGAKAEVVVPEKPVSNPVVIIEHCKQCQSFKRTAGKLEGLLKKAIPDLEVTMNPDKPRKGVFEVRDDEGNVFISLQNLTRPFKKMKDLNLEETAEDVVSKLS